MLLFNNNILIVCNVRDESAQHRPAAGQAAAEDREAGGEAGARVAEAAQGAESGVG